MSSHRFKVQVITRSASGKTPHIIPMVFVGPIPRAGETIALPAGDLLVCGVRYDYEHDIEETREAHAELCSIVLITCAVTAEVLRALTEP